METFSNQLAQAAAEQAQKTFLQTISDYYNRFISFIPEEYQWIASLIILLVVASFLWNLIRKNLLWIILLIVLFPGLLPVIKNIWESLLKLFTGSQ